MRTPLRLVGLAVAIGSCVAGAVISLMPMLVVGIVELFYNSAGGFLILLGRLINLAPGAGMPGQGGSSLPLFQTLGTHMGVVLLRSTSGAVFSAIAAIMVIRHRSGREDPPWLMIAICASLASIGGGWVVALALLPVLVISAGHLVLQVLGR